MDGPKQVIILSDGIRGHVNQSRGVARWLSRLAGSGVHELEIPRLSGTRRFFALKVSSRKLPSADKESAHRWLKESGGLVLCDEVGRICEESAVSGADLLFLSAGSSAAPFTLALARFFGGRAATVMTPSVLGTGPFDFAIVPAHDFPPESPNVFQTLGAPNAIDPGDLKREADVLLQRYPSPAGKKWGVLIGGNDANYRVTPEWVRRRIRPLAEQAMIQGADLYVTTSRRTAPETEEALLDLSAEFPVFRMLLLASKDPWNPVPGILGACDEVFCTEDSVSMVSEAATAGLVVRIMRVEKNEGWSRILQEAASSLVRKGALPGRFLWGTPRFDAMLEMFKAKGLATEAEGLKESPGKAGPFQEDSFHEARDAAAWIVREWNRKENASP
ncbi:MAG: nucleoside-diphosphate sugar epimerase [Synergistaceae bacterium]|nr:nucleoside-diphosphate sugar epimerase [Synergistaceae bacterium]